MSKRKEGVLFRLSVKGVMRLGLSEAASFEKILGADIRMEEAVDRTVELLSSGYKGHAVNVRHGHAIEVGSPAMNLRIILTYADGTDAGNARLQWSREVLDRLALSGKYFREGILTG